MISMIPVLQSTASPASRARLSRARASLWPPSSHAISASPVHHRDLTAHGSQAAVDLLRPAQGLFGLLGIAQTVLHLPDLKEDVCFGNPAVVRGDLGRGRIPLQNGQGVLEALECFHGTAGGKLNLRRSAPGVGLPLKVADLPVDLPGPGKVLHAAGGSTLHTCWNCARQRRAIATGV